MLLSCDTVANRLDIARNIKALAKQFLADKGWMDHGKCMEFYRNIVMPSAIYDDIPTIIKCPSLYETTRLKGEVIINTPVCQTLSNYYECPICICGVMFSCVEEAYYFLLKDIAPNIVDSDWYYLATVLATNKSHNVGVDFAVNYLKEQQVSSDTQHKLNIMYSVQKAKFEQGFDIRQDFKRFAGYHLIYNNNYHDNFWGVCKCEQCAEEIKNNYLGSILELVNADIG